MLIEFSDTDKLKKELSEGVVLDIMNAAIGSHWVPTTIYSKEAMVRVERLNMPTITQGFSGQNFIVTVTTIEVQYVEIALFMSDDILRCIFEGVKLGHKLKGLMLHEKPMHATHIMPAVQPAKNMYALPALRQEEPVLID